MALPPLKVDAAAADDDATDGRVGIWKAPLPDGTAELKSHCGKYCVNPCMKSEVITLTSFVTEARQAFICPPMASPGRGQKYTNKPQNIMYNHNCHFTTGGWIFGVVFNIYMFIYMFKHPRSKVSKLIFHPPPLPRFKHISGMNEFLEYIIDYLIILVLLIKDHIIISENPPSLVLGILWWGGQKLASYWLCISSKTPGTFFIISFLTTM